MNQNFSKYFFLATFILVAVPVQTRVYSAEIPSAKFTKCPTTPPPAIDYVWNPTYFDAQGEFFPLMMPDFATVTASIFNPNATLNDFSQLGCYRVNILNETGHSTTAFQKTVNMNCPRMTPPKWIPTCTFDAPNQKFDHNSWVVASDNKSWGLVLRCWNNAIYTWNVFSTLPVLTDAVTQQILAKVKTFGFNNNDFIKTDYTHCCDSV